MAMSRGPIRHEMMSWADVDRLVDTLVPQIKAVGSFDAMMMITRGGLVPGGLLCEILGISYVLTAAVDFPSEPGVGRAGLAAFPSFLQFPEDPLIERRRILIIDDVWGSGRTSTAVKSRCEGADANAFTCVFHFNPYRSLFSRAEPDFYGAVTDAHIIYPWEVDRGLKNLPMGMPEIG